MVNKSSTKTYGPSETSQQKMFDVVHSLGSGWHPTDKIAALLNKKRLNASERKALQYLATEGSIKKRVAPVTEMLSRYEYQASEFEQE